MVQGSLRCIGSGTHLKRTYGKGYKLTLTCPFDEAIRQKIHEYSPFVAILNYSFLTPVVGNTFHQVVSNRVTVVYEIDASAEIISRLVQELESHKVDFGIADWGISQATLDDVFIRLCGNAGHEG
jgi:hypothetical protein